METGSDGARRLRSGWLARGLHGDAQPELFETLALSLRPPLSLRGANAFAMPRPQSFGIGGASAPGMRAAVFYSLDAAGVVRSKGIDKVTNPTLGVYCVIAKSFARIFYRNAINNGLLLIENKELGIRCEVVSAETNIDGCSCSTARRKDVTQLRPLLTRRGRRPRRQARGGRDERHHAA